MKFRLAKEPLRFFEPDLNEVPITKYSPLFEVFNPLVLGLQAGGIIEQMAKFYYLDFHEVDDQRELEPIELEHMLTGTYGYIIGLVLATLAFIAEKLWMTKKRKSNKRKRFEN